MYSKVTLKVRINGRLGEGFQTFYGVKQGDPLIIIIIIIEGLSLFGDPLSTDLFGIMIEVLDEMLQFACPGIEVKIGTKCIHGKYYIDDLSIMTSKIPDLQRILGIVENFCVSFGFKVNISKTDIFVFKQERSKHS